MKITKSKVLFAASLFFLALGVFLLNQIEEFSTSSEINPSEGVAFMFIAFLVSLVSAIYYAKSNL